MARLSKAEVWAMIRAERLRLADDLAAVSPAVWETPSLCDGWTVHDALAHVVATAHTGTAGFVRDIVASRFDFDLANDRGVVQFARDDPRDTVADLRAAAGLRRSPPAPIATRLVEAIVHGEDIRRPLGIAGRYRVDAVLDALDYQLGASTKWGGSRERADGLRLIATDADFVHGEGAELRAPALELLMTMCGRP